MVLNYRTGSNCWKYIENNNWRNVIKFTYSPKKTKIKNGSFFMNLSIHNFLLKMQSSN